MSSPDPPQPPHQYISTAFPVEDSGRFWPPFLMEYDHPDLIPEFDRFPPFKRARNFEKPPNFEPVPPMNPKVNPQSVPGSRGIGHMFYKTRLCLKFKEGLCRNGEQCNFAHGVHDLREPPPNWQELVRERDRGNMGNNCDDDQRMMHRMKICKKYNNGEECPYGNNCNFLHERAPFPKLKADVQPWQRESSAISIGTTGDAMRSISDSDQPDNPLSKTVFWKTKMCIKWEIGQCPYGEKCHFAHGESELKSPGSLLEEKLVTTISSTPAKPVSSSAQIIAPASSMPAAPRNGDEKDERASKWNPNKKMNRIYGDWLDDGSPRRGSPSQEEI